MNIFSVITLFVQKSTKQLPGIQLVSDENFSDSSSQDSAFECLDGVTLKNRRKPPEKITLTDLSLCWQHSTFDRHIYKATWFLAKGASVLNCTNFIPHTFDQSILYLLMLLTLICST